MALQDIPGADLDAPMDPPAHCRVTVEEVGDIEPGGLLKRPWVGEYPLPAGSPLHHAKTFFEEIYDQKTGAGLSNFVPFADRDEWELASFLDWSGLSQEGINDYLTHNNTDLQTTSRTVPSYHNKRAFLQKIDVLPAAPEWTCEQFQVVSEVIDEDGEVRTEDLELWRCDPEQLFQDAEGGTRIYDETWTADSWSAETVAGRRNSRTCNTLFGQDDAVAILRRQASMAGLPHNRQHL